MKFKSLMLILLCLLSSSAIAQKKEKGSPSLDRLRQADTLIYQMSQEAHDFFLQKIAKADSLEQVIVALETRVQNLQSSLAFKQEDMLRVLIESDKIRAELEQTRFSLTLELDEMERRLKLLKVTHRQRRSMLRKYYPKLTRQQRGELIGSGIVAVAMAIFLGIISTK